MGRFIKSTATLFLFMILPLSAAAQRYLVPSGNLIGLHLRDGSITIADLDPEQSKPSVKAGLRIGDEIVKINGRSIAKVSDVPEMIGKSGGEIMLTYRRGSKEETVPIPVQPGQKLGLHLRQGIAGVGTVTWYDPETRAFGTLGHGVSNTHGILMNMQKGDAYTAAVTGLQPGRIGQPGALKGAALSDAPFGELTRNTPHGVFGSSRIPLPGTPIPVADWSALHTGPAQIRSTVNGENPQNYNVEIIRLYPERPDGRDMLLKVTDPALIGITGGIVQGMSGSPILQDGNLVGAVTHVLVSEPTMGYGIFIGNMLDAA